MPLLSLSNQELVLSLLLYVVQVHIFISRTTTTHIFFSSVQLFIDWLPPLALGPKVYQYIWKTFEDSHHSIDATVSAIQVGHLSGAELLCDLQSEPFFFL